MFVEKFCGPLLSTKEQHQATREHSSLCTDKPTRDASSFLFVTFCAEREMKCSPQGCEFRILLKPFIRHSLFAARFWLSTSSNRISNEIEIETPRFICLFTLQVRLYFADPGGAAPTDEHHQIKKHKMLFRRVTEPLSVEIVIKI